MPELITSNLGTIIVSVILITLVALAILKIIRDKKQGKCSCGERCAGCSSSGSCQYRRTNRSL